MAEYEIKDGVGIIPEGTTYVKDEAFKNCKELKSVVIPNSVKGIGAKSYYCYPGSNKVYLRYEGNCFEGCINLTNIRIPNTVSYIGYRAFYGCTSLTNIVIPDSVKRIDYEAFCGCTSLTNIVIPDSVTSIAKCAFEKTPWWNNQLDGLVYVNKVLLGYKGRIPENPFIAIKYGTVSISGRAFSGCTGLTNIVIPNSVTSIGGSAFSGCTGLTNIVIPNSVADIGAGAFRDCINLQCIKIPGSVSLGVRDDTKDSGYYPVFRGCTNLKYVKLCPGIKYIGFRLFQGCSSIETLKIPSSVSFIGVDAFEGCTGLKSIFIPEGVEEIDFTAFANCTALEKVVLPRSLKNLKKTAFKGCFALKEIIVPAANEKYIMKQLPSELHPVVKITTETLVDPTPEPVIEIPEELRKAIAEASSSTSLSSKIIGFIKNLLK